MKINFQHNKKIFRDFNEQFEAKIPLFYKSWWLDAVCGENNWEVIISFTKGKQIRGIMPIYRRSRMGIKFVSKPPLTQHNGFWIGYPPDLKNNKKISFTNLVCNDFIKQLQTLQPFHYKQSLSYEQTNWLPFYWEGFASSVNYTYVIDDLSDMDKVYDSINYRIKRGIKKAKRNKILIKEGMSIDLFYQIVNLTFERKKIKNPVSFEVYQRLDDACGKKNCRKIFYAIDEEGSIHGAIFIVWDNQSAYYLMGGFDVQKRNIGAPSLLLWEAIQFASTMNLKFDFEGSMIESVESFFRGFGAKQKPYFVIQKSYSFFAKILFTFYEVFGK